MAAAIGAELPIEEASGSLVVDIGGGTTEVGVVSLGGLVYANSIRVGGYKIDEAISNYIRTQHGIAIGEATSEAIKKEVASAVKEDETAEMQVAGHHIAEGVPRTITITNNEIHEAIGEPLAAIINAIRVALQNTPPELAADIANRGVTLAGGGALIKNLDRRVQQETLPAGAPGRGSADLRRPRLGRGPEVPGQHAQRLFQRRRRLGGCSSGDAPKRGGRRGLKFMLAVVLAWALIYVDNRLGSVTEQMRSTISSWLVKPMRIAAHAPGMMWQTTSTYFQTRAELEQRARRAGGKDSAAAGRAPAA